MDRRSTSVAARQRRLFGVDGTERVIADVTSLVLRLIAGSKVTEGDVHLARLKVWLIAYTERQNSEYELGKEPLCQGIDDDEPEV